MMNPKSLAVVCFGSAMVWICLAAANVARVRNGTIGGLLLVAGIVCTLRYLRSAVEDANHDRDPC